MEYRQKDLAEVTVYKADTEETFEDLSVGRSVEIINDLWTQRPIHIESLKQVDTETGEERGGLGYVNHFVSHYSDFAAFSERGIEIDRELVVRATAGMFIERAFPHSPVALPSGDTIFREDVRDYILRKVGKFRMTEHVLVDVEPLHPLQNLVKRWRRGEVEKLSDEWKIEYAKSFEGYCPDGYPFFCAYEYAEEFDLDIDFADEVDLGPLVSR